MTTRPSWEKSLKGHPYKKPHQDGGNKHSFEDTRVPPDNIGNHEDADPIASFVHDGLGNNIEGEPAHLQSGVLMEISPSHRRVVKRPITSPSMNHRGRLERHAPPPSYSPQKSQIVKNHDDRVPKSPVLPTPKKKILAAKLDLDVAKHQKSFSELWSKKRGTPLSLIFSAKSDEQQIPELSDDESVSLKNLMRELLTPYTLFSRVEPVMYEFFNRDCSVFYISMETMPGIFSDGLLASLRLALNPVLHEVKVFDCFIALDEERENVERTMMKSLGKIVKRRKIAESLPTV